MSEKKVEKNWLARELTDKEKDAYFAYFTHCTCEPEDQIEADTYNLLHPTYESGNTTEELQSNKNMYMELEKMRRYLGFLTQKLYEKGSIDKEDIEDIQVQLISVCQGFVHVKDQ